MTNTELLAQDAVRLFEARYKPNLKKTAVFDDIAKELRKSRRTIERYYYGTRKNSF